MSPSEKDCRSRTENDKDHVKGELFLHVVPIWRQRSLVSFPFNPFSGNCEAKFSKTSNFFRKRAGNKPGILVGEIPAKPKWCSIRETVFSWTRTRFLLHIRSTRTLKLDQAPVVTVTGKAFWDIDHAPKDQSNRRKNLPGYAVWEIHPVMKIEFD